jgi:hypothetical protein
VARREATRAAPFVAAYAAVSGSDAARRDGPAVLGQLNDCGESIRFCSLGFAAATSWALSKLSLIQTLSSATAASAGSGSGKSAFASITDSGVALLGPSTSSQKACSTPP